METFEMLLIGGLDNENYRQIKYIYPVSDMLSDSPVDSKEVLRQIDVKYSSLRSH